MPADWRYESYDGVQVRVPPDWGWGGAPIGTGADETSCGTDAVGIDAQLAIRILQETNLPSRMVLGRANLIAQRDFAPMLGITRGEWLTDKALRHKYGLITDAVHAPPPTFAPASSSSRAAAAPMPALAPVMATTVSVNSLVSAGMSHPFL